MKILFLILLVAAMGITFYDVDASCITPDHCYGITTTNELNTNYQGLHYTIEIPDLYIDETACEDMGAVVTGWINLEQIQGEFQWIENGVTVGWLNGECVTTESAYYAYAIIDEEGERVYVEELSDPHGDNIGVEKEFAIEKNSDDEWVIYYGDSLGLDPYGDPLDFGISIATGVDFGAEGVIDQDYTIAGSVDANAQYSTIPSTRVTNAEYKTNNSWTDLPTSVSIRNDPVQGYDIDVCAPGVFGAGASTEADCGFLAVLNTPPTITSVSNYDYNGTPIIIELTGVDTDKDYIKFELTSRPTNGEITNHANLSEYLTRNTPTSAILRYNTLPSSVIGSDSFTYSITDGRDGHSTSGTININILSLSDDNYAFFEDFENGLGNWISVDDDDGDTHDYDYWQTGISDETLGVDGDYAYIQDCDTGCTLTMFDSIDTTQLSNPWLRFDYYIDNIQFSDGDYYDIDYFDGSIWINLRHWDRDEGQGWHTENIDLASYTNANFKIRVSTISSGSSDYTIIDSVVIYDLGEPNAVTDLSTVGTSSSVTLSWTTPFDNGSAILDYEIQRQTESDSFVILENNYGDATTNSYTDNTVSDDTEYTYKIKARNAEGSSTNYSNLATVITPLGDRVPIIETINNVTVFAGITTSLPVYVSDLNDDDITFDVSGADFVSINKISNVEATLTIDSIASDIGTHTITVTATDTTLLFDTEDFDVIISVANTNPVISPIGNKSVIELETLSFIVNATDADGDAISFGIIPSLNFTLFTDHSNNTATFSATPGYYDSGIYNFNVTAYDGIDEVWQLFTLDVINIAIPDAPTNLLANAVSANEISLIWTTPINDGGSTITGYQIERNLNSTGFLVLVSDTGSISTDFLDTTLSGGDTAEYRISAINLAGVGSASTTATATTPLPNDTPVVTISSPIDGSTFDDSDSISFSGTAIDTEDGDISTSLIWISNIDGMIGNGSSSFTTLLTLGTHTITANVTDSGSAIGSNFITMDIANIEESVSSSTGSGVITIQTDAGVFSSISSVDESILPVAGKPATISFPDGFFSWIIADLDDGQTINVTITLPNPTPVNSQFWKVINDVWTNATSVLGSNDGDDAVTITLTDGGSFDADGMINGQITDPGGIAVLLPVNSLPIANDDTATVDEGQSTDIDILSNDDDSDGTIDVTSVNIVLFPVYGVSSVNATDGIVTYTHDGSESITDSFTYTVNDDKGESSNTATVSVTITLINDAPIIDAIDDQTTDELILLSFNATATDDDGDTLFFSLTNGTSGSIPTGAIIDADTGVFTWTPSESQVGLHTFDVTVTDGVLSDSETIQVTVNDITAPTISDLLLTINNPSPEVADSFGWSIASTSNGNIIVGTYRDSTSAKFTGSVYLFNGTDGTLLLTINNPTPEDNDLFGYSVASTSNGNIIVGAYQDNTGATDTGSVYLFNGTDGTLLLTINNPTPEDGDSFGYSVASTSNGNIIVGAYQDNTGAKDAGSAYLFDGTTGTLLLTINNPTPEDYDSFGYSIASTSNGNIIVSAISDSTNALYAGAVYLFNGTDGALLLTINNPTPEDYDRFGISVAATSNDNILVGAYQDNTGGKYAGSAYLFDGTDGALLLTINNPTPEDNDLFGFSVAATSNGNIIVGAISDDTGAKAAGSIYLFDGTTGTLLLTINNPTPEDYDFFGSTVVSTSNDNILVGAYLDDTDALYPGSVYVYSLT